MTDSEKKAESQRKFAERLGDWSEPGAITIIRNGIPIDDALIDDTVPSPPVVLGIDEDGNLRMSDGTIRVPG